MKLLIKTFAIALALMSFAACSQQSSPIQQHLGGCLSCNECQRVVYQYKFHGMPDCEDAPACRDTCSKIKEMWNTPWSPFEPFTKDIFGKCEICFRAGFCKISECKDQERREIEIINSVVNAAHLTAKVGPELMVDAPQGIFTYKSVDKIRILNAKVEKKLSRDLNKAIKFGSIKNVAPKIQNLVTNYFDRPDAPLVKSVSAAFSPRADPLGKPTPSMNEVTSLSDSVQKSTMQGMESLKKTVASLMAVVPEVKKMDPSQISAVKALEKKAKKNINTLEKKLNAKEKEAVKKVVKLENIEKSVVDPQKKDAIRKSETEMIKVMKVIDEAKKGLKTAKEFIGKTTVGTKTRRK